MNQKIIYSILLFIWATACYLVWKKNKDKDWLWFCLVGIVAGGLQLVSYFVARGIISLVIVLVNITGIVLLIRIILKSLPGKRKD